MLWQQITGGGNGLGRAISLALAKEGCTIFILDIDIVAADKTRDEILLLGVKAKAYKVMCNVFNLNHISKAPMFFTFSLATRLM